MKNKISVFLWNRSEECECANYITLFGAKLEHFIFHTEHKYTNVNSSEQHPQVSVTNALLDHDLDSCRDARHVLLNTFLNTASCQKTLFLNVSTVYHSTHDRKVAFCAKKNFHFMVGLKHKLPHVIFWAGMLSNLFDLPYLFAGPVNAPSQAKTLQVWLLTQLRHKTTHKIVQRKSCKMGPACGYALAMGKVRCDGERIYPNASTGIWTPVVQLKSSHLNNWATMTYSKIILQN